MTTIYDQISKLEEFVEAGNDEYWTYVEYLCLSWRSFSMFASDNLKDAIEREIKDTYEYVTTSFRIDTVTEQIPRTYTYIVDLEDE